MNLCQYKNMFGELQTGVHSIRFMNIAIVDVLLTLFGAWIISKLIGMNFWIIFIIAIAIGVILHRLFCVRTTVDKLFFPK